MMRENGGEFMKYNVGDKVVLRENLREYNHELYSDEMDYMKSDYFEIDNRNPEFYTVDGWEVSEDMIYRKKTAELNNSTSSKEVVKELGRQLRRVNTVNKDNENIVGSHRPTVGDPIEPEHYRKGDVDLYESWYQTRPFSEYRAIMESVAERYIKREKEDRIQDLEKAIYTLERLKEKEELEQ